MLARFRKAVQGDESGFTLIELLVVILIIGILAAIAIPVFLNQQKASRDATLKSDMKNLATVYTTYKAENPNASYPDFLYKWRNDFDGPGAEANKNVDVLAKYFTPSNNVRVHAFDYGEYSSERKNEYFCIQGGMDGSNYNGLTPNTRLTYSSKTGTFVQTCGV